MHKEEQRRPVNSRDGLYIVSGLGSDMMTFEQKPEGIELWIYEKNILGEGKIKYEALR